MPQIDLDEDEDIKLPLRELASAELQRMEEFLQFMNNVPRGPRTMLPSQFFNCFLAWRINGGEEFEPSPSFGVPVNVRIYMRKEHELRYKQRQLSELSGAQLAKPSAVNYNFNE